jgi:hypothetical protein
MMRFGAAYEHMIVLEQPDGVPRPSSGSLQRQAKRKRQVIIIHDAHHVVNADSHRNRETPATLPPTSYLSGGCTPIVRQARPLKFSELRRIQRRERADGSFLVARDVFVRR